MASYPGRRGQPGNMSQLLQDLNRVPEPVPQLDDMSANLDDELAMFSNTHFIDWDTPNVHGNAHPPPASVDGETPSSTTSPVDFDFNLQGDYNNFEFSNYPTPASVNGFSDNLSALAPIPPSNYNGSQQGSYGSSLSVAGEKRSADVASLPPRRQLSFEEQSRLAAEEDKRRRNTAASARFRVKKKAREQALEKREKELSDKVGALETRVQSLETENKWLRELVMEKNGGSETAVSVMLDKQKTTKSKESSKAKPESP
ncbi:hypothetical protein F5Y16DRAFT_165610 [Xylariaceae sp. FL0255]|nr:hypothetical protein F5Y16DRAFT_165610 [Xylariaceae sp. FL0255]